MNIREVYKKYSTPKNLQEHLLRVAGLSKIITDNWKGSVLNSEAIIKACCLHDLAKPITFDIAKQAAYGMLPEDIKNLENLQKEIIKKFGNVEHPAVIGICKEIGLDNEAVNVVDNLEWENIPNLLTKNNMEPLIAIYCDMRISPKGILRLEDRIDNLFKRYDPEYHDYESILKNGKVLEKRLQENMNIDVNLITDEQITSLFPELLNLEI